MGAGGVRERRGKKSRKKKVCPWIKWTWKKAGLELDWVLFAIKCMNMIHSNWYVLWLVNLLKYTSAHWKPAFLPSPLIGERWKDTCLREGETWKFFGSEIRNSPFKMINVNMHMGYLLLNRWGRIIPKRLSFTKAFLYQGPRWSEGKTTLFRSCWDAAFSYSYL